MANLMASQGTTAAPILTRLFAWHAAWLQRRRLAALDPHLRRDLGIARRADLRAAARPGWDIGLPGLR